jgi:hypothetical protein
MEMIKNKVMQVMVTEILERVSIFIFMPAATPI